MIKIGFWKDLWNDDDWCVHIRIITGINTLQTNQENIVKLINENRELRKQLNIKKVNANELSYH